MSDMMGVSASDMMGVSVGDMMGVRCEQYDGD